MLIYNYILPVFVCYLYGIILLFSYINKNILSNKIPLFIFIAFCLMLLIMRYPDLNNYLLNYKNQVERYNLGIEQIVNLIEDDKFINENILIDGAHIINYYSKHKKITNLEVLSRQNTDFFKRTKYLYEDINDKIKDNFYKLIIITESRNYSIHKINYLKDNNYELMDLNTYKVFILNN